MIITSIISTQSSDNNTKKEKPKQIKVKVKETQSFEDIFQQAIQGRCN